MKTTTTISYTPNYAGATKVNRQHQFKTPEEAAEFIKRMKRLYPDTKEI
jgi:hypothetical protein